MFRGARAGRRPADSWLAVGFVAAAGIEAVIRYHHQQALLVSNLVGALVFGCLALRRTRPLLTVSIMTVIFSIGSLLQAALLPHQSGDQIVPIFALLVVSYSLGAYASRRQLAWGAWQPLILVLVIDLTGPGDESLIGAAVFIAVFVSAAPILAGRLVRRRSTLVRLLRAQAEQIEQQRRAQIGAAVADERLRMSERFHASLVTGMESLATQLAAAAPGAGEPEITRIERAARELLSQTRQEVVALTAPVPPGEAPTPPSARPVSFADAAQPWTVLGGGALCAGLLVESRTLSLHVPIAVAWLACIVLAAPFALAWTRTLVMIAALWVATALFDLFIAPLDGTFSAIGLAFVPPFVVAALEPRRRALAGLAVCCLGELGAFGLRGLAENGAVVVVCWIAGAVLHERARLVEQLRANNAVLVEQRAIASRQAVAEERLRVARELHDAVGHSLTVIALQAGAARRICAADPARARNVLHTIATVADEGLAELREGTTPGRPVGATEPRLLDDLISSARAAGLHIDAHIDDVTTRLGTDAGFALYRLVQESLTNILKHAPGAPAELTIRAGGEDVEVVVANGAPGSRARPAPGLGHGLRGMRARVEACGGRIDWTQRDDGGFEVRAVLPAELAVR